MEEGFNLALVGGAVGGAIGVTVFMVAMLCIVAVILFQMKKRTKHSTG